MSQYPYPPNPQYPQPPQGAYPMPYAPMNPYGAMPAPARKMCRAAGILQMVIGAFMALFSFCVGFMAYMISSGQLPAGGEEGMAQLEQLAAELGVGTSTLLFAGGVCIFVPALLLIVLGIFVFRGVRWTIVASLVLGGLGMLWLLLNAAGSLSQGVVSGLCVSLVPLAFLGVLAVLLVMAWRETGTSQPLSPQAQMALYYQQYYQWQQMQQQMHQTQPPAASPQSPPPPPGQEPPPPPV